ncbi:uncharacterized protein SPPG_02671 [Spizellomyces punctatus DAOM BR117]|uniref:Restriction endonuclease type IV Mrr domain-containing protein n=1 Tax=Spizellomyces punctatus (strain DAOM BR117) TaxID=645134 RepID=A0A0L0HM65_SPIPD|nr:uncharacterized protein SPPG_02671 [Spizellomyces punctatus DAOM BR117]KND02182.1 hypothetical protein SPPG_02671 [Spizellomyces punctatus DAOM BR117]|eukprot:XP_016610221.1 hypothetical protein SPPG_02671 [Spizellomyces punctatus DAOM BR117]
MWAPLRVRLAFTSHRLVRDRTVLRSYGHTSTESLTPNVARLPSTVDVGTRFEEDTLRCLSRYGIDLRRVGGADDKGVDLRGRWRLPKEGGVDPALSSPGHHGGFLEFPIIVQCKKERTKLGPKYFRELEGTLARESPNTIALLASSEGFSTKAVDLLFASRVPLALAVINSDRICVRLALNRALQELVPGLMVYKNQSNELTVWYRNKSLTSI